MARKFNRGDIVRLRLNPTSGNEIQGDGRPALVLSPASFNALGAAFVAPITQGGNYSRYGGFAVALMGSGTETQGVVLVNMIRSVDLVARGALYVEKAPSSITDEVIAKLQAVLEG